MKIFCDLDGTLIDVVKRHYLVYFETVLEFGGVPIDRDMYWDLKRQKVKWLELLPLSNLPTYIEPQFLEKFISKIEDPNYLKLDTLFPESLKTIKTLRSFGDCYLVTLRRNRENVLKELEWLGLTPHFTEILTGHSESDGYDVKIALIKDKLGKDDGIIIGDTEADVMTGKELKLKTIAVTSGIRDTAFLAEMQPDTIVSGIGDVLKVISDN